MRSLIVSRVLCWDDTRGASVSSEPCCPTLPASRERKEKEGRKKKKRRKGGRGSTSRGVRGEE